MTQFPGLGIVIPLPVELPDSRESKPDEKQRPQLQSTGHAAAGAIKQVVAQIEPVHQRPGIAAHLGIDNLIRNPFEFLDQGARLRGRCVDRNEKVASAILDPSPGRDLPEYKGDTQRRFVQLEFEP